MLVDPPFPGLAVALAIGLLIGLERGWHQRDLPEGGRLAGFRTFGLVGLLGGVLAALAEPFGGWILAAGLLSVAALLVAGRLRARAEEHDRGLTTLVAALVAYALGALAVLGEGAAAAAAAVVTTLLLALKPRLHLWIARLSERDLLALLRLLLISVVVLPVLPDRGYGPYGGLNPFEIWWMVVLIAGLSFVGYAAMQILGPRAGLAVTAVAGGLVSSTAVTLGFARLSRDRGGLARPLAAGILTATAVSIARGVLLAALFAPALLPLLALPLGAMAAVALGGAALLWRRPAGDPPERPDFDNPVGLRAAIGFGLLVALVQILISAARTEVGDTGVVALAAITGFADIDALTLSVARLVPGGLEPGIAAMAIVVAILSNTAAKAAMAVGFGGGALRRLVLPALAAVLAAGGGTAGALALAAAG